MAMRLAACSADVTRGVGLLWRSVVGWTPSGSIVTPRSRGRSGRSGRDPRDVQLQHAEPARPLHGTWAVKPSPSVEYGICRSGRGLATRQRLENCVFQRLANGVVSPSNVSNLPANTATFSDKACVIATFVRCKSSLFETEISGKIVAGMNDPVSPLMD